MPEFKDLTGKQFGKWIVVSQARNHVTKKWKYIYEVVL